jgi:threonine/homoserine/homoserine lactone efflux protein
MNYLLFLMAAYFMGCIAAVPAGPVQIEVVRRSITGHLKSSLMVVLGAFFVDIIYGIIAFFGIAPFLEEKRVMAVFWLVGGMILIVLGMVTIRQSLRQVDLSDSPTFLKKKRWAFIGGLSLSGTNPVMILWWLSGVRIFEDIGLIQDFTSDIALSFLLAGSLGLASYLTVLSLFLYWAKKFISEKKVRQINFAFGVFLLLIAAYFIFTSFRNLLNVGS